MFIISNPKDIIAKANLALKSLENEDRISLEMVPVSKATGDSAIQKCLTYLKIDGYEFPDSKRKIEEINNKYTPFIPLFEEATKLTIPEGGGGAAESDYITGLKMIYGLNSRNYPTLLYQPVALLYNTGKPTKQRTYTVRLSANFYEFDRETNSFKKTTSQKAKADYENEFEMIPEEYGITFRKFIKDADVEAVYYSFQQIFAVLHENNVNKISIFNAIEHLREMGRKLTKHILLLAPEGVEPRTKEEKEMFSLRGVYADLAHLCPPHCNIVGYFLE